MISIVDKLTGPLFAFISEKSIKWYSPIICGLILVGPILFGLSQVFDTKGLSIILQSTIFAASFCMGALLIIMIRPKRFKEGTIGFILAIKTEDSSLESRVISDILPKVQDCLIKNTSISFSAQALRPVHSNLIEDDEIAIEYLKYCRGRFLLHGSLTKRKHKGEDCLSLKVRALVTHTLTTRENSNLLSHEMAAVIPKATNFSAKDELSGLEFTGEMIAFGAQYIVGIALFISGNMAEAIKTLKSLLSQINNANKKSQIGNSKIVPLIEKRLLEFSLLQIEQEYLKWRDDHKIERMQEIDFQVTQLPELWKQNVVALNQRAICHFVIRRNVSASKELIRRARVIDPKNSAIYYSQAFLEAYSGQITEAKRLYARGFQLDTQGELSLEVEEFLSWILKEEPDKTQLLFFLGYINHHKKQDLLSARRDLSLFLDQSDQKTHLLLRKEADELLSELDKIEHP